eukprot:9406539-Lingulodinium_polyedra.AAC.1
MPLGHEWNEVNLTPSQIAQNGAFLRIRRERHVVHDQRLGSMTGATFVIVPRLSSRVRVARARATCPRRIPGGCGAM